MSEYSIVDAVAVATRLRDEGDLEDARVVASRALRESDGAADEREARAIIEATELLIDLDAGAAPWTEVESHVDRMHRLTAGVEGADLAAARADAELGSLEWVHAADDDVDPVTLVGVLNAATAFDDRSRGHEDGRVRRSAAEAALTAQAIRGWLRQDPSSITASLESLAIGLATETDERMRHIRLIALTRAAESRIARDDDVDAAASDLRAVVAESAAVPAARSVSFEATLLLADISLGRGVPAFEALADALAVLHDDAPSGAGSVRDVRLRARHLDGILRRIPAVDHDEVAVAEWSRLIDRWLSDGDPRVRAAALDEVRYRAREVSEAAAADLAILRYADAAAAGDTHTETVAARLRVAIMIIEILGYPDPGGSATSAALRDPALAVRLSEDLARRFPGAHADPDLSVLLARTTLERALRLSDIGRRAEALTVLTGFRRQFSDVPTMPLRHLFAQASYWEGRLLRESGDRGGAERAVDAAVAEFGTDGDADVRVWAANALFSAWREPTISADRTEVLFDRFGELFADDVDVRIRRHDASGRLNRAVRAHERGATGQAVQALTALVDTFGEETDADIVDTVRLARENLAVLSLTASATTASTSESEAQYRALREQLDVADQQYNAGDAELAARQWRAIADIAVGSPDPNTALLGLAALDMLGGHLNDTRQWPALVEVAQRAMLTRGDLDYRAERMRASAYLRFGIAQSFIGDPRSALTAYESLDALVAASTDDEVMTTRQQAVYNRAVLIDDTGDAGAAITAYDHVLAVHGVSRDSQPRRLRRVKALRNKARLLDDLNLVVEAAHAHRQILDIATGNADPDLSERARASAFDLARCYAKLGDPSLAAHTYAWIRSQPSLGFTGAELRTAAQSQKGAERDARRLAKTRR